MDLSVQALDGSTYVIDVGVDDTTEDVRRKVASAAGLSEDSFEMSVGGSGAGEDIAITQLSAGDTIFLTQSRKHEAISMLRDLGETDLTEERLGCVSDPEVARLFLQAEVATAIPSRFLWNSHMTTLDLSQVSIVTEVGYYFLYSATSLTDLDVSGLVNVTHIGSHFAAECRSLRTLDLSRWTNVTEIDDSFLSNCVGLTDIDVSGFGNVTHIKDFFVYHCRELLRLDLSAMCRVTEVGDFFVAESRSLKTIELAALRHVTRIGKNFLSASTVTTVDLSTWRSVERVKFDFLYNCREVTALDISGFQNMTEIPGSFLCNCWALSALDLSALSNVTRIDDGFLYSCKGLTSLDLSPLSKVGKANYTSFLRNCVKLRRIDISGCSSAVEEEVCKMHEGREGRDVMILKDGVRVGAPPPPQKTCSCS